MEQYLQSFYTVRFSDCDPFRHLNNARYIDYFLNAREDHLRDAYQMRLSDFYKKGIGWVVMQHEIIYLKPATLNETICICSGILDLTTDYLVVELIMLDEKKKQLKSIMHTRFIPVNLSTGKREPHNQELMDFFSDKVLPANMKISLKEKAEHYNHFLSNQPA